MSVQNDRAPPFGFACGHIGSAIVTLVLSTSVACFTAAQDAPFSVTVIAPRPPTAAELAGENVAHFVTSHSKAAVLTGHLSRWRTGVCPSSRGLSPASNDFVTARIRAVAASVGAPTQPAGQCKTNVDIVFAIQPQKILDDIVKGGKSWLLGFHYPRQTKRIATMNHPIQGWYVTLTRGCHGAEVLDEAFPLWGAGNVPPGCLGSRLTDRRSTLIAATFIIVDAEKVVGMQIGSISDYLAVLTLTQAQPPESCGGLPSIMDLMAPECDREKATAVTAGDLAYLRALYRTDLEQQISLEKSDIENNMMRQFKGQ